MSRLNFHRWVVAGIVCCGLGLASACKTGGSSGGAMTGPVSVPLVFHPQDDVRAEGMVMGSPKVFIKAVTDDRMAMSMVMPTTAPAGQVQIGSTDKGGMFPVYDTGATPVQFVHDALADQLTKHGINVVNNASDADKMLTVSIKQFSADEAGTFSGTVTLMVSLSNKIGSQLGLSSPSGTDTHFGHDREPEGYQIVLSNSMVRAVNELFKDSMFVSKLTGQ